MVAWEVELEVWSPTLCLYVVCGVGLLVYLVKNIVSLSASPLDKVFFNEWNLRDGTLVPALLTIYSTGIGLRDPYSSSKLL